MPSCVIVSWYFLHNGDQQSNKGCRFQSERSLIEDSASDLTVISHERKCEIDHTEHREGTLTTTLLCLIPGCIRVVSSVRTRALWFKPVNHWTTDIWWCISNSTMSKRFATAGMCIILCLWFSSASTNRCKRAICAYRYTHKHMCTQPHTISHKHSHTLSISVSYSLTVLNTWAKRVFQKKSNTHSSLAHAKQYTHTHTNTE